MGNAYHKVNPIIVESLVKHGMKNLHIEIFADRYTFRQINWYPTEAEVMVYYRRLSDRAKDEFYTAHIANRDYALATLVFHATHNPLVELIGHGEVLRIPYWKEFSWQWESRMVKLHHKKVKESKSGQA